MLDDLASARSLLAAEGFKTEFISIDIIKESVLASNNGVSLPTLKYVARGNAEDYGGASGVEQFVAYVKHRERPSARLMSKAESRAFLTSTPPGALRVVARVKPESVRKKAYSQALPLLLDSLIRSFHLEFAVVHLKAAADAKKDAELLAYRGKGGAEEPPNRIPAVALPPDHSLFKYKQNWTASRIVNWTMQKSFFYIGNRFTDLYHPKHLGAMGFHGAVVYCSTWNETRTIRPFVQTYRSWKFTLCNPLELSAGDKELLVGNAHDVSEQWLTVLLVRGDSYKRHVLNGRTIHVGPAVEQFLANVSSGSGTTETKIRSEQEPKKDYNKDGVLKVVGSSFQRHVFNSSSDVFVRLWMPQCKHCAEAKPKWEELGRTVRARGWDRRGVVIADFDVSQNDGPEEDTDSMPKFFLYPAVAKDRKMTDKREWWPPGGLTTYKDFEIDSWLDFLTEASVNLANYETEEAEREFARKHKKRGRSSKARGSGREL
eukprot:TRINITY_DN17516_c0_g1_i2.p1 TRINITY_DN17516_c0_g1~~TRINITY_DN17516_c0_g1_i2.p1  ORF type:complete len:488 (-),score=86.07 TRINITY_DN17516_c0_g1_i2:98-1561(-)